MFLDIKCGSTNLPDFIGYLVSLVYFAIRVAVPILLIIAGMFDLGKAIVSKKEEEVKKAKNLLFKKFLLGIVVFLIPYLVELLIKLLTHDDELLNCVKNLIDYRTNLF